MEIFYSQHLAGKQVILDSEESSHCVRVLRHSTGDEVVIVDGLGTMMKCRLDEASQKEAKAEVLETFPNWNGHSYSLNMAVCPTKNSDRFEWFVEKATEIGVDVISPIIGERSERRIFKSDRSKKIALSAMKQSLKAKLPLVEEPISVKDFILAHKDNADEIKLIAYCFEGEKGRLDVKSALDKAGVGSKICILIGPEGDFSQQEAELALASGFLPIHLGASRLRTETAAVVATASCYFHFMNI